MNNEIKERIKYFKHYVVDNLSLDAQDDFQKILDYITNLQTIEQQYSALLSENAELKEVNNYSKRELYKINKDRLEANLKLVEENERLSKKILLYNLSGKIPYLNYRKVAKDYKSRVEKAREYNNQVIKDTKDFYRPTSDVIYSGDTLIDIAMQNINILNGGDNNV